MAAAGGEQHAAPHVTALAAAAEPPNQPRSAACPAPPHLSALAAARPSAARGGPAGRLHRCVRRRTVQGEARAYGREAARRAADAALCQAASHEGGGRHRRGRGGGEMGGEGALCKAKPCGATWWRHRWRRRQPAATSRGSVSQPSPRPRAIRGGSGAAPRALRTCAPSSRGRAAQGREWAVVERAEGRSLAAPLGLPEGARPASHGFRAAPDGGVRQRAAAARKGGIPQWSREVLEYTRVLDRRRTCTACRKLCQSVVCALRKSDAPARTV